MEAHVISHKVTPVMVSAFETLNVILYELYKVIIMLYVYTVEGLTNFFDQ